MPTAIELLTKALTDGGYDGMTRKRDKCPICYCLTGEVCFSFGRDCLAGFVVRDAEGKVTGITTERPEPDENKHRYGPCIRWQRETCGTCTREWDFDCRAFPDTQMACEHWSSANERRDCTGPLWQHETCGTCWDFHRTAKPCIMANFSDQACAAWRNKKEPTDGNE